MCYTGIVYAARTDTTDYTFQASGSLWQDALVMQDLETRSLWSQVSGECIQGELEGKRLTLVPSMHTTFAKFASQYPAGLVLKKPALGPSGSGYDGYMRDSSKLGIFGRIDNFERAPAKSLVYGLRLNGRRVAVTQSYLSESSWAIIDNTDPVIVVTYDRASKTAAAFSLGSSGIRSPATIRVVGDRIRAGNQKLAWNSMTGRLVEGEGSDLQPVPLVTAYWFAWASFFPTSDLID